MILILYSDQALNTYLKTLVHRQSSLFKRKRKSAKIDTAILVSQSLSVTRKKKIYRAPVYKQLVHNRFYNCCHIVKKFKKNENYNEYVVLN